MIRAILTDIEGTTSSIRFVHEVLFPYARAHLGEFVMTHASEPAVAEQIAAVQREAGLPDEVPLSALIDVLHEWIDADRKVTPLKALQGMVWEAGYRAGAFRGHVYADAVAALRAWHAAGIALYIYSSGSVHAQKLMFGHSEFGDLTPLFSGYFDTTSGHKREAAAYCRIAAAIGLPAKQILFLSDVVEELDAARAAGMATWLLRRDDEPLQDASHRQAADFTQIDLDA